MRLPFLLLCLALLLLGQAGARADDVWIDSDCALGLPLRDVDDAFALVQALHSPEIRIRGISATFGNGPVEESVRAAQQIVERFGQAAGVTVTMVHRGAASAAELGKPTPATAALRGALQERKLVYIALGPLTNLMTALRLHPDLKKRLRAVVVLASRESGERLKIGRWNPYPFTDANFVKDPAAMNELLQIEDLTAVFVPARLTLGCTMTPAGLDALARSSPAGEWLAARCRLWLRTWRWLFGVEGGPLFDSVAILAATHPDLLPTDIRFVRIEHQHGRDVLIASDRPAGMMARLVKEVSPQANALIHERLRARAEPRKSDE